MRLRQLFSALKSARPGLSLMELVVVMALMVIVAAAGFTLFQLGARHEARQQDVLNQTQNLRTSLYTLARDVRMAGNGLGLIGVSTVDIFVQDKFADPQAGEGAGTGWFRHKGDTAGPSGVRAIYGLDGGPDNCGRDEPSACRPDVLTVFRAELENPLNLGRLSGSFTPGTDDRLNLRDSVREGQTIRDGDILVVAHGSRAVVVQAELGAGTETDSLQLGQRFAPAPGAALPGAFVFPPGSTVYNVRDVVFVTYYIDRSEGQQAGGGHNLLMANYHDDPVTPGGDKGLLAIAGNIENLQVGYFLTVPGEAGFSQGGALEPGTPPDKLSQGQVVRLAAINLTSRSSRNRDGGLAAGGVPVTRQTLAENVALRNNNSF